MSINSSKGISVPSFQPASSKGDGGGMGGGGMYFGQQQQDQQDQENPFFRRRSYKMVGTEDMTFVAPLFHSNSDAMNLWKTALANQHYKNISKN